MGPTSQLVPLLRSTNSTASTAAFRTYGRSPPYRRIHQLPNRYGRRLSSHSLPHPSGHPVTGVLASRTYLPRSSFRLDPSRSFFNASPRLDEVKDRPRDDASSEKQKEAKEGKGSASEGERPGEDPNADQKGREESGEGPKGSKKEESAPPPPHGDKSPWQVFTETLRKEFQASKEWNESTKALASSAHQFTESDGVKRARAAYSAASDAAGSRASDALRTAGRALGQGAAWTWGTPVVKGVRKGANAMGRGLDTATKPVRETAAYKSVKEVIDDGSSSKYGGWVEKEERRKLREQKEAKDGQRKVTRLEEDPNAGTNVTLHKDAAWRESWNNFRDSNRLMQGLFSLKSSYNESDNPFISTARSISDRVAGFFAENETAMVIKKFREMDPSFQIEPFLREMREYILPEVLDAYVTGDTETLRQWLSAAQFQVYAALQQQWKQAGLRQDGRILDIRHVDILSARLLEPGAVPVFIVTARTQEVHVFRQMKTGQLAAGMEDKVQLVTYAVGVTRTPEDVNNPETRGWRLIELQKSNRDYI